jgi:hypothetical protein
MSDDYRSTIASLITVRDNLLTQISSTAASLAAIPAVPNYSESGDGGSEMIDTVGLRAQLMNEIRELSQQVKEISITIASLQAGFGVLRVHVNGRVCAPWLR